VYKLSASCVRREKIEFSHRTAAMKNKVFDLSKAELVAKPKEALDGG
jgi:hypothetical protein